MVETTGLRRLSAPTWLLIAAILGPASALHAQASEADTEVDPATGFPSGYWVEFGDGEDWMRLTSGEWLRGNLNWMRDGDFELGLGYQFLRVLSTPPNVPNPQSDGFIPVHTYWEFEITDDIELDLRWQSNIVFTTIGNTNHFGEAVFSVEVTDILNFNTEFDYYRTEQPIPREDGSLPESNDFQLVVGFSIKVG